MALLPLLLMSATACANLQRPEPPDSGALRVAWRQYADGFVERDGRVVDPSPEGELSDVTTSEGQSYALLRAAWMGDRRTFRRVLRWTTENLQGGDPAALPAWKWGPRGDGTYGVLDPQPASDADQLIAYALLIAHARWGREAWREQALGLLETIWEQEVEQVGPTLVMLPGPWAKDTDPARLNPSYFLPFALRAFAGVDPGRGWDRLLDDSYLVLEACTQDSGLPPDWCWLDRETGEVAPPPEGMEDKLVFGFEAFRVAWNLAADAQWYGEPRARELLEGIDAMHLPWRSTGYIPGIINPDGSAAVDWYYVGMYGAVLPAWGLTRPEDASALYARNIVPERHETYWAKPDAYYTQNWVWFGLALWTSLALPPERYR